MPRARCGRPPVARVARWVDEGRRFGWRPEVGAPVAQDGPDGAPGPVAELAREEELEPRVGPSKEAFEGRDDRAILGPPLGGIVAHAEDVVEGRHAREAVGAVGGEAEPGQQKGDSTSLQRECSARARSVKSIHASRPFQEMIARPKISQNEWKTAEI